MVIKVLNWWIPMHHAPYAVLIFQPFSQPVFIMVVVIGVVVLLHFKYHIHL